MDGSYSDSNNSSNDRDIWVFHRCKNLIYGRQSCATLCSVMTVTVIPDELAVCILKVQAGPRIVTYDAHLATAPQHIPTQRDMLPQHLVYTYELNCKYSNINLAKNKAPWWWSDKIETCRSVLKCFKSVLCEIICAFVGW